MYGQGTKFARVIKISQILVYHFTTPLSTIPFSCVLTLKPSLSSRCFQAKIVRTHFSQSTTGQLLLIVAISILMKGELENKTVNC